MISVPKLKLRLSKLITEVQIKMFSSADGNMPQEQNGKHSLEIERNASDLGSLIGAVRNRT